MLPLVVLVALSGLAGSAAPIDLGGAERVPLGRHLELFVDDGGLLGADEVLASARFTRSSLTVPSFGIRKKVVWVRFRTRPATLSASASHDDWFLRSGFPHPDRVDLFTMGEDGVPTLRGSAGLHLGADPEILLPIEHPGAAPAVHLLRLEVRPARVNLELIVAPKLLEKRGARMLLVGLYGGIFLGLFLYNLFLGLSLRDGSHALYCVFLLCMATHIFTREGLGPVVGPDVIFVRGGGLTMTNLAMLVFARRFLQLKARGGWLDRCVVTAMAGSALLFCASLAGASLSAVSMVSSALCIALVVVAAVTVSLTGDRPALWFLVAWSVLITSCVWAVVHAFGWVDASFWTQHGMAVGSALEMILLSLALAARVRALRTEKEQAELALARARASAQAELAGRVIEAQETERARYARELHDGLGHTLLLLKERLRQATRAGRAIDVDEAQKLGDEAQACIDDARAIARNLVPPSLAGLGLVEALRIAASDLSAAGEADVRFDDLRAAGTEELFGDRAIHLLRVAQEAITNALVHGGARRITLAIAVEGDDVVLTVADDGCGFEPPALPTKGLGLLDMQQRAKLLRGEVHVTSTVGRGSLVTCRVPSPVVPWPQGTP